MLLLLNSIGAPRMIWLSRTSIWPSRPAVSVARAGRELVLRDERAGVDGQVSEVARVPEDDRLHHAVVDVRLVDVRQRQADHVDVLAAGLPHRLGRARHRRRRDRHHQLHRRIDLQQRLRLGERLVAVVVARADRHQLQPGMLVREPLPDERDPLVLVRGAERAGDDRELALCRRAAAPLRRSARWRCLRRSPG